MPSITFPLPLGSAARWAAYQRMHLHEEGFGEAVLDAVQPLFFEFARSGEQRHIEQAHRLLRGEV